MAKEQIPEFKNQSRIRGGVSTPSFQDDTSSIAFTKTPVGMLGELSTNLAMKASKVMAAKQGYELGKNPQGDLGIPLTSADDAFQKAYYSQASSTLGLQASEMMQKAQLTLAGTDKISPSLISSYQEKMQDGLSSILDNAPSAVKPALQNSFNSALVQSVGSITTRMIKEQKHDERNNALNNNINTSKELFENGVSGNIDAGKIALKDFNELNDSFVETNTLSPREADAAKESGLVSFYSGIMGNKANEARNEGKLETFLDDMSEGKNKPSELTGLQWQQVQRKTLAQVMLKDNLESRQNNLLVSDINRQLAETGTVSSGSLSQAESQLPTTSYNNLLTSVLKKQNAGQSKALKISKLISGWNDSEVFSKYSADIINQAYTQQAQHNVQEHPEKDMWNVETEIAMSAAGPIPAYTKEMEFKLKSSNPTELESGFKAFKVMMDHNPMAISSMPKNAEDMGYAYTANVNRGLDPQTSAQNSYETIYKKDKDQRDTNTHNYKNYMDHNKLYNPVHALAFAKKIADLPWRTEIADSTIFKNRVMHMFKSNFHQFDSDADTAMEKTSDALKLSFGTTKINGRSQYMYAPIEKVVGLGEDAAPVILMDMQLNLGAQFKDLKNSFDSDKSNLFYYELQAREDLLSNSPIKVNKVFRDGHKQELEINIQSNDLVSMTNDRNQPVAGDYYFNQVHDGRHSPLSGSGSMGRVFVYRPNVRKIRNAYNQYYMLNNVQKKQMKAEKEVINDFMGRDISRKKLKAKRHEEGILEGRDILDLMMG